MPFLKVDRPHKCKLPGLFWRGGKPRQPGTRWYCAECKIIYEINHTGKEWEWLDTGTKYDDSLDK